MKSPSCLFEFKQVVENWKYGGSCRDFWCLGSHQNKKKSTSINSGLTPRMLTFFFKASLNTGLKWLLCQSQSQKLGFGVLENSLHDTGFAEIGMVQFLDCIWPVTELGPGWHWATSEAVTRVITDYNIIVDYPLTLSLGSLGLHQQASTLAMISEDWRHQYTDQKLLVNM